jgi:C4-dicarboxylate-specific signal transduction histidine kinase
VAWRLREQVFVATLVLLVPLAAVMTWAAGKTYSEQIAQVTAEAQALAGVIAAHIDEARPEDDGRLNEFLRRLPLPAVGMSIVIRDRNGRVIALRKDGDDFVEELAAGYAGVHRQPWTVSVTAPTSLAWWRTSEVYRRALAVASIGTLIMLVMEFVVLRRWLRALTRFERAAQRVGAGDLQTPPREPMPSRELEHLRDVFSSMVVKLREAREAIALQVEEERRMREEVESLQQQVIRQERLAAIGVLLSGIAHELNNPLQAIFGFADLLQRDKQLGEPVRADLGLIKKESARASAIIRNLSRFSRQQSPAPGTVYLRDVVSSVLELRQRRWNEQDIKFDLDDRSDHPVRAVFTELQQVLLNFVINAEQALAAAEASRRRLVIRTFDGEDGVHLEVEDSGDGVPTEHEGKLFQPFFTTKPIGEGTGLGLSVSYGIVRSFGGRIGYRRAASGGAVFFTILPVGEAFSASAPPPAQKIAAGL